jgi:acetyl esterase/lipase
MRIRADWWFDFNMAQPIPSNLALLKACSCAQKLGFRAASPHKDNPMKATCIGSIFTQLSMTLFIGSSLALAQNSICSTPVVAQSVRAQSTGFDGATAHIFKSVDGVDLRLHVFEPTHRSATKLPAIVFFFGGGWMSGDVASLLPQARYFAGRGVVTILADYRVYCRNNVDITQEMADAKSAIRWVRSHAKQLGVDPKRIVASGGSSGGHLALSTAVFDTFDESGEDVRTSSKPNALVLFYPCVDETAEEEKQYSAPALGNHGEDVSPKYHVAKGLPPMIVLQGTGDPLYAGVKKYCADVGKFGNSCEFVQYEVAPHGFFDPARYDGKWYRPSLLEMDRFLTKLSYLKGPSPKLVP